MLQHNKEHSSFLARHTRLFAQSVPVVGPLFHKGDSWAKALENSGRGFSGLLGGASLMFFNALYGIDLMEVETLVSISTMIIMMELGDKGGRLFYNLTLDSLSYIVKSILEDQPELRKHFSQWKRNIIQPAMEPGMLVSGVLGMWAGMQTMPIKPNRNSEIENALIKTTNMEIGMLPLMTTAMIIAHEAMNCCTPLHEEEERNGLIISS